LSNCSPIAHVDISAFGKELEAIRDEAVSAIDVNDLKHLKRVEWYGRFATIFGYATAWIAFNPIASFFISLGHFTRWLVAHHVSHRGYDKVPGMPDRLTSRYFAKGYRRFLDWFDWIHPAAWYYEHNILHHYHTGEEKDPDLVERYTEYLRNLKIPLFLKYIAMGIASISWKIIYYAPNTISTLDPVNHKRLKDDHLVFITLRNIFELTNPVVRRLWTSCYLPYGVVHFVLIPLLFLPLGSNAVFWVFVNKILAEAMTNFHSFLVIGPNHTADDLYRYQFHYDNKDQFYVTQIMGSVNYRCGHEIPDYLCIWVNYQIEHHLFPDLPMLKYRMIQPKVKALCQKYNVPYRQESVFKRFQRMLAVCVGTASMRQLEEFPQTLNTNTSMAAN
jgi:fatty acid desaturase